MEELSGSSTTAWTTRTTQLQCCGVTVVRAVATSRGSTDRRHYDAGLRLVGIDRPGYGLSTPQPGRTIAGWVPDALAVAAHLGIDRFVTVGVSTGGAYALGVAAVAPDSVLGVVACCSVTDMRHGPARVDHESPAHACSLGRT